ncbi:MAG TPA: DUF924 family protein [Casimicrobiaceae bacterium]|nr:DUF924 family protein [Casimicrobiaceae bacterium]
MDVAPPAILDFWFGAPGSPERGRARKAWYRADPVFDEEIRRRFGDAVTAALAGAYGQWSATAQGAVARILLLDQFTRNLFRGTPRAFEGDALALATSEDAVSRGVDRELGFYERWFLYMPFEHAESVPAQHRSLELFGELSKQMQDDDSLVWARKHAEVVFRFGRYPHRNAILGRPSTPEEEAFLRGPGSRF